jgi:ADP-ribose pyrophosphatase YjhB (NUDIX family)
LPTEAPSLELVKRKLEKKGVTNICTEWTIPGGWLQEKRL